MSPRDLWDAGNPRPWLSPLKLLALLAAVCLVAWLLAVTLEQFR
jgi:hypothetical protein